MVTEYLCIIFMSLQNILHKHKLTHVHKPTPTAANAHITDNLPTLNICILRHIQTHALPLTPHVYMHVSTKTCTHMYIQMYSYRVTLAYINVLIYIFTYLIR